MKQDKCRKCGAKLRYYTEAVDEYQDALGVLVVCIVEWAHCVWCQYSDEIESYWIDDEGNER